jgi:predicted nucleotidyltransferase
MAFPDGIEGDYLESKGDNLIFDVKGLLHPKDRKICFIRFYPDPKGERIRKGIKYTKIYDIDKRYAYLRNNYPKYLFYSKELDLELQGVKNRQIKEIYTPRGFIKELQEKSNLSNNEKISKKLCELLITKGNLPEYSIGISGSPMVGLTKDDSDIDIIIYGTEISLKFQEFLKLILNSSKTCRRYNMNEFKNHYKWRVGGSDISFEDFMKSEQRKNHQGKFMESDFFIRYLKSPQDWSGNFYDFSYKSYGRIKIIAEIVDATDSIFTPCSYKIKIVNVLDESQIIKKVNKIDIIEINSFRGRFCEHAIKGEKVLVEGKLEKVLFKGKEEYFRILLGDQIRDKMIILNP